jgi:hypothetical protein
MTLRRVGRRSYAEEISEIRGLFYQRDKEHADNRR